MPRTGLFIPCYIDQFYPQVGIATLQLLEKLGCEVDYPTDQTCCGQPLANSGYQQDTIGIMENFTDNFREHEYIVCPSGSCTLHVKENLDSQRDRDAASHIRSNIYELVEFLYDILKVQQLDTSFPHRVGLHVSCHGARGLGLGGGTELNQPPVNKTEALLSKVKDIELVPVSNPDECCGFGGTFAVFEEALSVKMGRDRVRDHEIHGAEVITAGDMSCLMHLEGIIRRKGHGPKVMHVSQILNGAEL